MCQDSRCERTRAAVMASPVAMVIPPPPSALLISRPLFSSLSGVCRTAEVVERSTPAEQHRCLTHHDRMCYKDKKCDGRKKRIGRGKGERDRGIEWVCNYYSTITCSVRLIHTKSEFHAQKHG